MNRIRRASGLLLPTLILCGPLAAQPPRGERPPEFVSPEVSADRKITFRIHAPAAEAVRLNSSDIPGIGFGGAEMTAGERGVWEVTVGPVPAGACRYRFDVDGVAVNDPRNTATSEANSHTFSLVVVPGSDRFDRRQVPQGSIAEVQYFSKSLDRFRRMHVYTPPGYESGEGEFPVLYLLHGASDSDDSWSSVGRAGVILDNLVADGRAKPMIVVMPNGHTGPFSFGGGRGNSFENQMREFQDDFAKDIRPYVESTYRVKTGREDRAIAGLSMGGAQALNVAFDDLADYGYVGVFSSGVFGIAGGFGAQEPSDEWEKAHAETLDNTELKENLKLVWFGTGKEDFLLRTSQATVEMLKQHDFDVTYEETEGGHTWLVWRDYLWDFAPLLFADE
jgi:enterochelin esterase-like enzyme